MVCIGVLHCMDLGVTQETLGNIMWEYVLHGDLEGKNQQTKVMALWVKLKGRYKAVKPPTRHKASQWR